jgi:uncharacterized protein (TIGR00255 family)
MTIASMTGFAREAGVTEPFRWVWELKTVNARGLDVRLRVPAGYDALADEARQMIAAALGRGTCYAGLTLTRSEAAPQVRINEPVVRTLIESIGRIPWPDGVTPLSVDGLLAVRGVVEIVDESEDAAFNEMLAGDLRAALGRGIEQLRQARLSEGQALLAIVSSKLQRIAALTEAAQDCPGRRPEAIRARLAEQVNALMVTGAAFDAQRLHQEAVLMAAKADVREELDRLKAHCAAASALIADGGTVGRRLDFLAQEFSREANTLCAKANDVALSAIGLDLKTVVEQFREQVQNVE